MSCRKNKKVTPLTLQEGTWFKKNNEDIFIYSCSLCGGKNGSAIGFKSTGSALLGLVANDGKVFFKEVDENGNVKNYPINDIDMLYELFKLFLINVRALAVDECCEPAPISVDEEKIN